MSWYDLCVLMDVMDKLTNNEQTVEKPVFILPLYFYAPLRHPDTLTESLSSDLRSPRLPAHCRSHPLPLPVVPGSPLHPPLTKPPLR